MIAGWMLHLVILSVLLAGAARAAEGALGLYRRPVRWSWLAALWLPLLLPPAGWAWRLVAPAPAAVASELPPAGGGTILPALDLLAPASAAPPALDWILGGAWLLLALAAAGVIAAGHRRLGRRARSWSPERVGGAEVWLSRDFGPAVVGVLRPRIVLPRWLLDLPRAELEATLLHEREHRRAGDTRLLLAGLAAVVLTPWSPTAWWAFRRMREAVEIDCDRRVLRRGIRRSEYGAALLTVGRRGGDAFLAAAALSEPPSFLERRLKMITAFEPRGRLVRAAALSLAAGVLVLVACETPRPTEAPPSSDPEEELASDAVDAAPVSAASTVQPEVTNLQEVVDAVREHYPPLLRDAGVGGRVTVWFHLSDDGEVGEARVSESSGHEVLDRAALRAARTARFTPALNDGRPVAVWVQVPVTFTP